MSQTKKQSLVEVGTNIATGIVGSLAITLAVLHLVDDKTLAAVANVILCTAWSFARGYTIRRYFNKPAPVVQSIADEDSFDYQGSLVRSMLRDQAVTVDCPVCRAQPTVDCWPGRIHKRRHDLSWHMSARRVDFERKNW